MWQDHEDKNVSRVSVLSMFILNRSDVCDILLLVALGFFFFGALWALWALDSTMSVH